MRRPAALVGKPVNHKICRLSQRNSRQTQPVFSSVPDSEPCFVDDVERSLGGAAEAGEARCENDFADPFFARLRPKAHPNLL